ncbi:Hemin import ATP-binding protein HmuV [Corynebacterium ciconiae DSM 44920]|uniref:heme ABC transporter ATP-binding protein n=1 Tax=Corynebacterium ciconiae TaxID=227319 RepID=UPI000376033D|nr:heme ABC transporter ATP-binding protein [Corynebacterium ciconiae]WKD60466.1 Hemin import ATP-binding protein HmuV [Corynebacterium ciconiae DSM 44920]
MSTPLLSAHNLTVSITVDNTTRELLSDISIELHPGEILGLIGPNGAGKSTLLAALSGDYSPTHGEVRLAGRSYTDTSPRTAGQLRSVMLQDTSVAFSFSVADVVAMGRTPWTSDPTRDAKIVDDALELLDLTDFADREVSTLSGGERARAALARVIAQQSQAMLLDEPIAAMDIGRAEATMHTIREVANGGRGVLIIVHDLATAARHCDRLVLLHRGRVAATGTPREVCTPEILSAVYGWNIDVSWDGDQPWIRPR